MNRARPHPALGLVSAVLAALALAVGVLASDRPHSPTPRSQARPLLTTSAQFVVVTHGAFITASN